MEERMPRLRGLLTPLTLLVGLLCLGCATYKITQPLDQIIDTAATWHIGEIKDGLPPDMDPDDRPQTHNLTVIKGYLKAELQKKDFFVEAGLPQADELEVTGTLLEFNKGSAFLLFMFGGLFGGSPTITMELQLVNRATSEVLFSGNFKQTTTDWMESLDDCYERLAKDFAKALEKEEKRLHEEEGF
jgi:hypothetical protein